ncbi:hypothetical protein GYMLUDRAFT_240374 [Collybiopsis luxurians FD-317 M1]|nr:hypothetical protein GYMLUDRAFT_240374 [Collybiopsis luxurians FD-317 M1]
MDFPTSYSSSSSSISHFYQIYQGHRLCIHCVPVSSNARRPNSALSLLSTGECDECLPFLFANIQIDDAQDVERLRDDCSLFSMLTKYGLSDSKSTHSNWVFQNAKVDVCKPSTTLLQAMQEHPTVSTVLVEYLTDICLQSDMSKLMLQETSGFSGPGERITKLLGREFQLANIRRPPKVALSLGRRPVELSWLPQFAANRPHLQKLHLRDELCYFVHHKPPFIGHFVEECGRRDLSKYFDIKEVGLSVAVGRPLQDWHVTEITLDFTSIRNPLGELLQFVASSFPELESLSLDFIRHENIYNIDDFVDGLCPFSRLRYLYLYQILRRLEVRHEESPEAFTKFVCEEEQVQSIEDDLLCYTSRIAKKVISLDAVFINEHEIGVFQSNFKWRLRGWLHVLGGTGSRRVDGQLHRKRY